jgi:hypothetical protein
MLSDKFHTFLTIIPYMQKIISFLIVATLSTPLAFAATGDNVMAPPVQPTTGSTPANTITPITTTASVVPVTASQSMSLGENKSISCSTNSAFGANSCDQCFDGGSVTVGKRLTGLFDNWTNNTTSLMIAYQSEQKNPNMIAFGSTKWITSPSDEAKVWKNSSDIIWTPTQSGATKLQYILGAGQKIKFIETDLGAGYTLDKTDRKNGDLVGMMKFPIVSHIVDGVGNEGLAKTHNECVAYTLSAAATVAPVVPEKVTPITPAITKTETGPTETLILIIAAFFIAFGLMFSLRKRI